MKKITIISFFAIIFIVLSVFLISNIEEKYTITFKVDNSVFYTLKTNGYEELEFPSNPLKQNFTFEGWYFDKNTWTNELTTTYFLSGGIDSDIVVYAKFFQSCKIISFYVNGNIYSTFNFLEEDNFTLPNNPTLTEYVFDGWYFDNDIWQEEANITNIPAAVEYSNKNVYAKFVPQRETQTVNFYVKDEIYYTDMLNDDFVMPNNPSIDYYNFDGWYFDENVWEEEVTLDSIKQKADSQINIYAKISTEYASNLRYILSDDETYYIVKGRGECTSNKILIPNYYNDLPVKEIGSTAFREDETLEEVIIGSNVEKLNLQPFGLCKSLTKVEFMKNSKLHTLGRYSFNGCSLTYLFVPKGITEIPEGCFAGFDGEEIIFEAPENIIYLNDYAFSGSSFTALPIFPNLEKIGAHALNGCGELKRFYLPKSLKYIGESAFNDARKLTYVEMEDLRAWMDVEIVGGRFSMPWVHARGFYINNEMVVDLNIPDGVKEIKDFAFFGYNYNIESITIPESIESIGTAAFADILRIKTINFNAKNCILSIESNPSDLAYPFENVGKYTISGMGPNWKPPEGYKDIIINFGEKVESIPSKLFYSPSGYYPASIGTINFTAIIPPAIGENWITTTKILKAINVPNQSVDAYKLQLEESLHTYVNGVA